MDEAVYARKYPGRFVGDSRVHRSDVRDVLRRRFGRNALDGLGQVQDVGQSLTTAFSSFITSVAQALPNVLFPGQVTPVPKPPAPAPSLLGGMGIGTLLLIGVGVFFLMRRK